MDDLRLVGESIDKAAKTSDLENESSLKTSNSPAEGESFGNLISQHSQELKLREAVGTNMSGFPQNETSNEKTHTNYLTGGPTRLHIHERSEEIGRVILTGAPNSPINDQKSNHFEPDPNEYLARFIGEQKDQENDLASHIRQAMVGGLTTGTPEKGLDSSSKENLNTKFSNENVHQKIGIDTVNAREPENRFLRASLDVKSELGGHGLKSETGESLDSRVISARDLQGANAHNQTELRINRGLDSLAQPLQSSLETDSMTHTSNQRFGDESSNQNHGRENQGHRGDHPYRDQAQENYANWKESLAELVEEKVTIALREGFWSVKLNLDAVGLDPIDITLKSDENGIQGQIYASDPSTRDLLNRSLHKLSKELENSFARNGEIRIEIEVLDGKRDKTDWEETETRFIAITASELLKKAQMPIKSGDGFDIFV